MPSTGAPNEMANAMAKLGRESPALLDEWHARLRAAKDAAARAAALDNAVRERPGAKRQRLGGGASASLSALAMQVQGAAAATATPETEAEAAAAVRRLMNEQGCCAGAENAFLHGFVGRSNDFMYKDLKSGASMPECMMKSTVCSSSCKHSSQCTKWCGSWFKLRCDQEVRFIVLYTWPLRGRESGTATPAKVVQNKNTHLQTASEHPPRPKPVRLLGPTARAPSTSRPRPPRPATSRTVIYESARRSPCAPPRLRSLARQQLAPDTS